MGCTRGYSRWQTMSLLFKSLKKSYCEILTWIKTKANLVSRSLFSPSFAWVSSNCSNSSAIFQTVSLTGFECKHNMPNYPTNVAKPTYKVEYQSTSRALQEPANLYDFTYANILHNLVFIVWNKVTSPLWSDMLLIFMHNAGERSSCAILKMWGFNSLHHTDSFNCYNLCPYK